MGFRMTKTEIQCIEDLSINEVFTEREKKINVLRFDIWNSYYQLHFTMDFIYLFSVSDLKMYKLPSCCCFLFILK